MRLNWSGRVTIGSSTNINSGVMERASELTGMCGCVLEVRDGVCEAPFATVVSGIEAGSVASARPAGSQAVTSSDMLPQDAEGVLVRVTGAAQPLCISLTGSGRCSVAVEVEEGGNAELIFLVSDAASADRVFSVGRGASLRIREIVCASEDVFLSSKFRLEEGARSETVSVELGSGAAQMKYIASLEGRLSEAVHAGLFMAGDGERKAVDIRIEHLVPDCRSDVLIKGVASGTGHGSFEGMVYVAQDAQHTEAYQQSRNLIMGGRARIVTSPQLEIYADDVRCSHGATVGQMNDEAVYYMRQRGLSEAEARGLQLTGFVNDVISRLGEGEFADKVVAAAAEKIGRLQNAV